MSSSKQWIRVSRAEPCPVCGKPDNCTVSSDGAVVWCGRVSEGSIRENAGGQYLHRLTDTWRPRVACTATKPRALSRAQDYSGLAARLSSEGFEGRTRLAELLGLKESALARLNVGWDRWAETWSFPELDAVGRVIGINVRHLNGDKKRLPGGKAGLTYADDWNAGDGLIVLVEGGSDTAALIGIGVNAVGRPSNLGGVDLLAELLDGVPASREIVVLGERDEKDDGKWPGRDGAVRTAERLSEELERPIGWSLPPDNAKDARAWLLAMPRIPDVRLLALFVSGLQTTVIEPPPRFSYHVDVSPPVALDDWRDAMLQSRIDILYYPGCYLDASSTGAGKSHLDFATIMHGFAMEGP